MKFNIRGVQTGRLTLPLPTHDCEWSPYGVLQRMPTFVYHKPMYPDHPEWDITWALGTIKLRADGRWSWWRNRLGPGLAHWPAWRAGQGIALTKMGAMYDVQDGWVTQEQARLFPIDPTPMALVYEYSQDVRHDHNTWEMNVVLGRVIDTHTDVFPWQRSKSKYHPNWKPGCGHATSIKEASLRLMEGWS
jgi:hypothetical protein